MEWTVFFNLISKIKYKDKRNEILLICMTKNRRLHKHNLEQKRLHNGCRLTMDGILQIEIG